MECKTEKVAYLGPSLVLRLWASSREWFFVLFCFVLILILAEVWGVLAESQGNRGGLEKSLKVHREELRGL